MVHFILSECVCVWLILCSMRNSRAFFSPHLSSSVINEYWTTKHGWKRIFKFYLMNFSFGSYCAKKKTENRKTKKGKREKLHYLCVGVIASDVKIHRITSMFHIALRLRTYTFSFLFFYFFSFHFMNVWHKLMTLP